MTGGKSAEYLRPNQAVCRSEYRAAPVLEAQDAMSTKVRDAAEHKERAQHECTKEHGRKHARELLHARSEVHAKARSDVHPEREADCDEPKDDVDSEQVVSRRVELEHHEALGVLDPVLQELHFSADRVDLLR